MRFGIDLGGTKMAAIAIDASGKEAARLRLPTPDNYDAILAGCAEMIAGLSKTTGVKASVGVCMPGAVDSVKGMVRFSPNIHPLAGRSFVADMKSRHGLEVRIGNDANCFVLSEASDGAAAGLHTVYGVILGTGVGGSIAVRGRISEGPNAMREWGHIPLPWAEKGDLDLRCGCGQTGCIETILSGPALTKQLREALGRELGHEELQLAANSHDPAVKPIIDRYSNRLAKALAMIILLLDPDAIVLGGGLSNLDFIYRDVPELIKRYTILRDIRTPLLKAKYGADSGLRGAAWLWPEN